MMANPEPILVEIVEWMLRFFDSIEGEALAPGIGRIADLTTTYGGLQLE